MNPPAETLEVPETPHIRLLLRRPIGPEATYQDLLRRLKRGESYTVEADELLHLRVRLGLALGEITPEQVKLFFIEQLPSFEEENFSTMEIGVDALGDVSTWPKGLYGEAVELVKRLRQAQARAEGAKP